MSKLAQTKGYVFLTGKIFGIEGKEPISTQYKNSLKIRVRTSKENTVFLNVGGWLSSTMTCKLKAQGMEKADEIALGEVADVLKDYFAEGESVLVRASVEVNTYKEGRLDLNVNGIYSCSEEIDFDSPTFEERNELTIPAIISGVADDNSIPVKFVSYKGEEIDQVLKFKSDVIKDFLKDNVNVGDLVPMTLAVKNVPIYEEVKEDTEQPKARKSLMGKSIGGGSGAKRKITGSDNYIEILDIDVEKIETKKYQLEQQEIPDMPF